MTSEIQKELLENLHKMQEIISNQEFKVKDAQRFLKRYDNIARKMEDLENSRDNWKKKYNKLNEEIKDLRK